MYTPPPPPPDESTLPQQPRIRPIWLIGGTAALVILGVCALISVAAAALLIWFSSSISSSSNIPPTRVVVAQNPTQVLTAVAPTPLPPINTALPFVTVPSFVTAPPFVTATPALSLSAAPDQAVRSYFQLVSQKRYDLTWPLLTNAFKQKFNCCAPNYDYLGYITWWNSVNHVDFGTVSTISQDANRAIVYAELYYVMNTGARSGVDSNPYFELLYDSFSATWQLNDKRAAP